MPISSAPLARLPLLATMPLQGKRVISVACGAEHSVCCTEEGEVYAWGWGRYGNLGEFLA